MSCRVAGALLVGAAAAFAAFQVHAADPAAAERQYRVARRLAAEGSPQAAEALRKVVELDPQGALADDALVEQALLERLARWPEELGRLREDAARRALALLSRVVDEFAEADRAIEARYYRALVRLEPLAGFDLSAARFDLVTVATTRQPGPWPRAARYAGGWMAEQSGETQRAALAYQRLLVDAPASEATTRARAGLARLLLRDGEPGRAAHLLDAAQSDAPAALAVGPLKELAVRSVLVAVGKGIEPQAKTVVVPGTGIRKLAGMAVVAEGLLLADPRAGSVLVLGEDGRVAGSWALDDPQAVAADPLGRMFAAAGERLYRLVPGRPAEPAGSQGDFSPVAALAADALGHLWVVDRRGERVGRLAPGASHPTEVWRSSGSSRVAAVAWDGWRLLALDTRQRAVIGIARDGREQRVRTAELQRPVALAVNAAGHVAVLDGRDDSIPIVDRRGATVARVDCRAAGISRPAAIAFGIDGVLHVFDEASGTWVKLP